MSQTQNSDDAIILQAFSLAVSNPNVQLSEPLHQEIQKVGNAVKQQHTTAAAQSVLALVEQSDRLKQYYKKEYDRLNQQDAQRTKFLNGNGNGTATLTWRDPVVEILSADNFYTAAKSFTQRRQAKTTEVESYTIALRHTIQAIEAQKLNLLQTLHQQILAVEDLGRVLKLQPQDDRG
jgi:hypothetical protein